MDQKLTLFELTQWIKDSLDSAIPGTVWVVAEISELTENRNGHCYLELVEKNKNEMIARARATIWSYTYRILKPYFETTTGQLFKQGLKVLLEISVEYHPVYGLSLNIKDIDPAYTMGDMALQRKEIIERLQREGVFGLNKELNLPLVPQRIAVISSKTAAGYQDFIDQIENNPQGIRFYPHIFEAYMQGDGATSSIIAALERIFSHEDFFDAVAIIRGGGAVADLSCFDNYELAFHITQFPLPVVTGIGHEKDDTIIDLVAHTRLKTPTAVAEFFISGAERFLERINSLEEEVVEAVHKTVNAKRKQLDHFAEIVQKGVGYFINEKSRLLMKQGNALQQQVSRYTYNRRYLLNNLRHRIHSTLAVWRGLKKGRSDRLKSRLGQVSQEILQKKEGVVQRLIERTGSTATRFLAGERERIVLNEKTVQLLHPGNVLSRGYTLTLTKGKIVKSVALLNPDEEIETRFADGKVRSIIIKKEEDGNTKSNLQ